MANRYEILDRLATGGMAEIYRARAIGAGGFRKLVVVKKILPSFTSDAEFVRMFVEEAKLAAELHHGNIVQVYDLGRSVDGEYFIVMEFVHGHDLGDLLEDLGRRGGALGLGETISIARQVCAGLDYAHRKRGPDGRPLGIIHRDVSPQNVLISYEGEVKLTDFGIAKARTRTETTEAGFLKGKYGYMSPEQARGEPLDQRSDLFNVGILLYEMLAGERLFEGSDDHSTLHQMRNVEVVPLEKLRADLPPALVSIVHRALAPRPEDRHQSAAELDQDLSRLSFELGVVISGADLARLMERTYGRPSSSPDLPSGTRVIDLQALAEGLPGAMGDAALEEEGPGGGGQRPPTVSLQPGRSVLRSAGARPATVPLPPWVRGGVVLLAFLVAMAAGLLALRPSAEEGGLAWPVRVPAGDSEAGAVAEGASPARSSLLVRGAPPDAHLEVDGEVRARRLPALLSLEAGAHEVRLLHPGRVTRQSEIVTEGGEVKVLELELQARTFPLRVRTRPSRATLFVDGKLAGRSPRTLSLPPGRHRIVAKKKGRAPALAEIEAGAQRRLALVLPRREELGAVEISAYPSARLRVGRRILDVGEAPLRVALPAGRRRLHLEAGQAERVLEVEVRPGEITRVFADLVLSSPRP